ncbi:MAG: M23 family metallopeptidase [Dehalococcoidia bacterium]
MSTAIGVVAWLHDGSGGGDEGDAMVFTRSVLATLSMPAAPQSGPPPASKPGEPPSAPALAFIWPADGWIVQGMWAGHPSGIDIGAATGDPVVAVRDGKVAFAGGDSCCSYGNYIIIQHDDGWSSLYGHLSAFNVKLGDDVKQGDRIGSIGMTGHADGPHVHFELRSYGGVVDPLSYLSPHRTAPPPPAKSPSFVAAPPSGGGPQVPAPAQPTPEPVNGGLSASAAISAAAPWLSSNADASYRLDYDSCRATPTGPNWIVSCRAELQACADPTVCGATLSACVISQPILVASIC